MSEAERAKLLPVLIPVDALQHWLGLIFPEGTAHRNYVVREMAAKTLFVMLYCGAIEGTGCWFRPAQATLMTDFQARKDAPEERRAWTNHSLMAGKLRPSSRSWYAPNSREPIRDETLRNGLIPCSAVVEKPGVPTTSSAPRYAIRKSFYELLAALQGGVASTDAIAEWQKKHLTAEAFARVMLLKSGVAASESGSRIPIQFPNGESRLMLNGPSAILTKAVIENFAPQFLRSPAVLFISDSGEKIVARDEQLAARVGLQIEAARNLPDIILLDIAEGRERIVFIEVVATDRAITAKRKEALGQIAAKAKFAPSSVYFVSAFLDRTTPAFRRLSAELAWDTFAWFASEPEHLLCYRANAQLLLTGLS